MSKNITIVCAAAFAVAFADMAANIEWNTESVKNFKLVTKPEIQTRPASDIPTIELQDYAQNEANKFLWKGIASKSGSPFVLKTRIIVHTEIIHDQNIKDWATYIPTVQNGKLITIRDVLTTLRDKMIGPSGTNRQWFEAQADDGYKHGVSISCYSPPYGVHPGPYFKFICNQITPINGRAKRRPAPPRNHGRLGQKKPRP
jgi:hypothetical protein